MRFGSVDKESADVGFFNGGEGADGGKLLDADFAFAGAAETGGVKDFDWALVVVNLDAVDVTRGALAGTDDSLLFLTKGVEEAGFANVWATD